MNGLISKLLVACVTLLLAVLALQYASQILQHIWPTLAVAGIVVLGGVGAFYLIRSRTNRW